MQVCKMVMLFAVMLVVGCSGQSEPVQPKLTEEQIKEVMKQGAMQREGQDARGNLPQEEAPTVKKK